MPDMDGVEVILKLHKMDPTVKLIVMSGGGDAGTGAEYLDSIKTIMNTPHIIAKPFELSELMAIVNKAINSSQ
jgi:DNA-binding NtrC family response regulator